MASGIYNRFKANLLKGLADVSGSGSHSVYVALLLSTYTFNADHNYYTGLTIYEHGATGTYVAGGIVLANKTVTQNDSSDLAYFDADDSTWAASTLTARYAVLYDNTLNTKDLICAFDFSTDQSSSSGNFTIQWNGSGILQLA